MVVRGDQFKIVVKPPATPHRMRVNRSESSVTTVPTPFGCNSLHRWLAPAVAQWMRKKATTGMRIGNPKGHSQAPTGYRPRRGPARQAPRITEQDRPDPAAVRQRLRYRRIWRVRGSSSG